MIETQHPLNYAGPPQEGDAPQGTRAAVVLPSAAFVVGHLGVEYVVARIRLTHQIANVPAGYGGRVVKLHDRFEEDMIIETCYGFAEGFTLLLVIAVMTSRIRMRRSVCLGVCVEALALGGIASLLRWGLYACGIELPLLIDFGVAIVIAIFSALLLAGVQHLKAISASAEIGVTAQAPLHRTESSLNEEPFRPRDAPD